MQINQLMTELDGLFPGTFATADKRGAWERKYAEQLNPGPNLQIAFDRCIAALGPSRKSCPKPSDLVKHYPSENRGRDDPGDTHRPAGQVWADHLLLGQWGHEAAICKPSFCRELIVWGKANPGQIPGDDVLIALGDNEAQFQTKTYRVPRGMFASIVRGAGGAMNEFEQRSRARHVKHCEQCQKGRAEPAEASG